MLRGYNATSKLRKSPQKWQGKKIVYIFFQFVCLHINNMKYWQRIVICFTSSGDGILDMKVVDQIIWIGLEQ